MTKILQKMLRRSKVHPGQSIFFGDFIQRLGFTSGGFPQDILIQNTVTAENLKFRVKPTFKSGRHNSFCYFLEPGTYYILNYAWTQSKWYGARMYNEPIIKGIDTADDLRNKRPIPDNLITDPSKRFSFTIPQNAICNLGIWNFDKGLVSFERGTETFVEKMKSKYKKINFSGAISVIPN